VFVVDVADDRRPAAPPAPPEAVSPSPRLPAPEPPAGPRAADEASRCDAEVTSPRPASILAAIMRGIARPDRSGDPDPDNGLRFAGLNGRNEVIVDAIELLVEPRFPIMFVTPLIRPWMIFSPAPNSIERSVNGQRRQPNERAPTLVRGPARFAPRSRYDGHAEPLQRWREQNDPAELGALRPGLRSRTCSPHRLASAC
jgi:hypothetical protein